MEKFTIIFRGEILPEHDPETVKTRLAKAFQLADPHQLEAPSSGMEVALRRAPDQKDASVLSKTLS